MNRRKNLVAITLAALVAGAAVLVYAEGGDIPPRAQAEDKTAPADHGGRLPDPAGKAEDNSAQATDGPEVLYDATALPEPVQRMLRDIIIAARTGNIEAMRTVLESNELKPMVAAAHVADPIAYWKEQSVDGSGRDVLAAMLNLLDSGFVLTGKDHDAMYVWPYFAKADLGKLTPAQEVELYRVVPPKRAAAMKKKGKYDYYRLGVSPSGVWHYFIQ
jgi:hypothetical protein